MNAIPQLIVLLSFGLAYYVVGKNVSEINKARLDLEERFSRESKRRCLTRNMFGGISDDQLAIAPGDTPDIVCAKEKLTTLREESLKCMIKGMKIALVGIGLAIVSSIFERIGS